MKKVGEKLACCTKTFTFVPKIKGKMKRIPFIAALALLCLSVSLGTWAGDKSWQKLCKKECKQLEKEGWKVMGKPQTLVEALTPYYEGLSTDTLRQIVVTSEGTNPNVALSRARRMASAEYAAQRETQVQSDVSVLTAQRAEGDSVVSRERMEASTKTSTNQRVRAFSPLVTLVRKTEGGKDEVRLYYLYEVQKPKAVHQGQSNK